MSGDDLPVREDGQPSSRLSGLDDEGLLAVVREMLSRSEAAPDWSAELAKGSYDLRAVDAELAVRARRTGCGRARVPGIDGRERVHARRRSPAPVRLHSPTQRS